MVFFFKQKTAYEMRISDWSSDVCSSDLRRDNEHRDRTPRVVGGDLQRNRVNDRRDDERRARQRIDEQNRLSREQQRRRIHEERERAERYRNERRDWQRRAQQRAHRLQQQRRMAKYRYQQQYYDRLRRQQVSWSTRSYNYYNDPYYYTPNRYRYSYQGNWQRTNRYGADLIRQAINYGYQEGLYAGRADRQDNWRNDYRDSYAYQDANYGYNRQPGRPPRRE